ncbi:hypothetical protein Tco_0874873 [Tanacetum coccineum]|uniref:Uncharacterized protein n=1 Tax=Tanacetum coccineum TaxID=301880 RepID=A0ABQ5BQU9_9ASTR
MLRAEVDDSWRLQGDVEELWSEYAKLGLAWRCCLVLVVPRVERETKRRMWSFYHQERELDILVSFYGSKELRHHGAWLQRISSKLVKLQK